MHPESKITLNNLKRFALFRPLSNVERREGFSEEYFAQVQEVFHFGHRSLTNQEISSNEADNMRLLLNAARHLLNLVANYQKSQLENTTNLFNEELGNMGALVSPLKALQSDPDMGLVASHLGAAIFNMRGMILKNQGKKAEAKAAFEEALTLVSADSLASAVIKVNAASLTDTLSEKDMINAATDTVVLQETALASIYVAKAVNLRKENDRTPNGIQKLNDLYEKANILFPDSNIIRNNWALYLCDEDEFDPFARTLEELQHAAELFRESIKKDPQRSLIVAPTYLAVTYYKMAAQLAKTDSKKALDFHESCKDMLAMARKMIQDDEAAQTSGQLFQYDANYRQAKREHFNKIERELVKLNVGPKPILSRYHTTMPTPGVSLSISTSSPATTSSLVMK